MGNAPASEKCGSSAPAGQPLGLPEDACCLKCGYLLRGLSAPRCPECGREFDPADRSTYGPFVSWVRRWQRRYSGPPSWPKTTVIIGASAWFFEGFTRPCEFRDMALDRWVLLATIWLVVALDYSVTIVASVTYGSQMAGVPKGRWYDAAARWALTPAALLLVFLCVASSGPADLRFAVSRPALENAARDMLLGKQVHTPRRIGLYWIWRAGVLGNGVGFKTGTFRGFAAGFECRWPANLPRTRDSLERTAPTWQRTRW